MGLGSTHWVTIMLLLFCFTAFQGPPFLPPECANFRNDCTLTGLDKCNPLKLETSLHVTVGKDPYFKALNGTAAMGKITGDDAPDEESRPKPVTILRQQGIHPNPGPDGQELVSILDDECWHLWEWTNDADKGTREPCATLARVENSQVKGSRGRETVGVCDLTYLDGGEPDDSDLRDCNDGFSD